MLTISLAKKTSSNGTHARLAGFGKLRVRFVVTVTLK
jgi:hypothetical protein